MILPPFPARSLRARLCLATCAAALLGLATPAEAQMRLGQCGQPGALTPANVTLQPGGSFETFLSPDRGETRYVDITLPGPGRVTLRTEAEGGLDPLLVLFDTRGQVIASDDDGAGGLDSLIEADLPAGSYCVQLRLFGAQVPEGGAGVHLAMSVSGGAQAQGAAGLPLDPAEACAVSGLPVVGAPVPGGQPLGTSLSVPQGGRDAVRFTLGFPLTLRIDAESGEFDTVLMLLDSSGRLVAENDDIRPGTTDSRIEAALQPGTYCATVAPWGMSGGGSYRLTLADAAVAGAMDAPCADSALTEAAGLLSPGDSIAIGSLLSDGGPRFVSFSMAEGSLMRLDASSGAFDTVLRLYDAAGQLIGENDDFGGSTDSRIEQPLAPGAYCAEVTGFGGRGSGPFTLEMAALGASGGASGGAMAGAGDLPCDDPRRTTFLPSLAPGEGAIQRSMELPDPAGWFFEIDIMATGPLVLDAGSRDFDTMLALYAQDGTLLAENDDFGGSTDSRIETMVQSGTYCVGVTPFPGSGTGMFTLTADMGGGGAAPGGAPSAGGGLMAPRPLVNWPTPDLDAVSGGLPAGVTPRDLGTLGSRSLGGLVSGEEAGWFAFTLDAPADLAISVRGAAGAAGLALLSEGGETLGSALPDPTGGTELFLPLGAGRYVVGLTPLSGDDPAGIRRLTIRAQ